MKFDTKYVKLSLNEDDTTLISSHYISEVLPKTKHFQDFNTSQLMALINDSKQSLSLRFANSKKFNERQVEDALIRPILESLGNSLRAQIALNGDTVDFCVFTPNNNIKPDGFALDYSNTCAIIESKRWGRIENKYFVSKEDNSDEVYQTLNYLRTMNLTLTHNKSNHRVPFVVLTDGYRWRLYSKDFTHNFKEYERNFIEFDLEAIVNCTDDVQREQMIKLFGWFFCKESLAGGLIKHQKESKELEVAVTIALKEQTYTALEYIATGIWRLIYVEEDYDLIDKLRNYYDIDVELAKSDEEERTRLLKIIYDESLVYLLRLLFVLYAEDRNLFDNKEIPKVIKGEGNILELVISKHKGIGEITTDDDFERNDDVRLADIYNRIDKKYNGGLFSGKKHRLLYKLDMDDTLFANAVDNLCRVQVKNNIYSVDFSTISVRELGGIYESLLEYKLAIIDKDMQELPSIINKKRVRHNVAKGDLYLINHNGQRKATGSYYTPDLIVEHLVSTALMPKLEEIKAKYFDISKEDKAIVLKKDKKTIVQDFLKDVMSVKTCDPAMGSGHMIQAIYGRIVGFIQQSVEEMHDAGLNITWTSDLSYFVRSQVALKCIYGCDLNPIAVELAKLVLWMKVFRKDKPFEFLDYNLVCGNSLVGIYDETSENTANGQGTLFISQEEQEQALQEILLKNVDTMVSMPRTSVEEVHKVEDFWKAHVKPIQRELSFFYNVKLAKWLMPESKEFIQDAYDSEDMLQDITNGLYTVEDIIHKSEKVPEKVRKLADIEQNVSTEFKPIHWRIAFPHVASKGGFTTILSNPPWDKVKANHNEFFSDYIQGYADMEASAAKKLAEKYMDEHTLVRKRWEIYNRNIDTQNAFYQDSYKYQISRDSAGKTLKGDANLYKVFMEKIYTILQENGACGIVIPDNFNIDNGCTGLRRLLLNETSIKELIMFENRKRLFDIHGQYKFNVMTFVKKKPRTNASFDAGFYWYEPLWLDSVPDDEYIVTDEKNKKAYHSKYKYSVQFVKDTNPETYIIYEFRNKNLVSVFKKIQGFPSSGEANEPLHIDTFREFDMTLDSDLFNNKGTGWPLLQGGVIHHYSITNAPVSKYVISTEGEARLAKKWKVKPKDLPDRTYRMAWRSIAQPTDTRSLINTVVFRGSFCGNSLNEAKVVCNGEVSKDYSLISGVNTIFSSFCADFYVRQRIAKNVNAFIVKCIPMPRNIEVIKELGSMAMPLYAGEEFESFRDGVTEITDDIQRKKLIAKLDARVAHLYGLTYEEYQAILSTFPLVDEEQKKRCLTAFNDWMFLL